MGCGVPGYNKQFADWQLVIELRQLEMLSYKFFIIFIMFLFLDSIILGMLEMLSNKIDIKYKIF
jgi:hypothetical protein